MKSWARPSQRKAAVPPLRALAKPLLNSASLIARVEATRPPVSTCAPLPNRMPLRLIRKTWPSLLADRRPKTRLGLSPPTTRLSAAAPLSAMSKVTLLSAPMSKLFHW